MEWPFPPIDVSSFSWEALATLVTGGLAVAAATYVGRKQTKIAERQTEIFHRQVALAELDIRSELFERRFAVYEAARALLSDVLRTGERPEPEYERNFLIALDQSRFLFRAVVYEALQQLWRDVCDFGANRAQMQANFRRSGDYGQEHIDRNYEQSIAFSRRLETLSELFGDELRLSYQEVSQ